MDNSSKINKSGLFFLQSNVKFHNKKDDGKLGQMIGFGNPSLFHSFIENKRIFIDAWDLPDFSQTILLMLSHCGFDEQTDSFVPVFMSS